MNSDKPDADKPATGPAPSALDKPGAETVQLLELASQLGRRDAATLTIIVRRASEIYEAEGEDSAMAVLEQIERILKGDVPDA